MFNWLFSALFRLFGWRIDGKFDYSLKKGMLIVCPHASWVDFPVGVGARASLGVKMGYWGKAELFKPPFGWFFRALGGFPVDRSKSNNLVDGIAKIFNTQEELFMVITPEGSRKDVEKLKTGFYYVALQVSIPVIMVGFDYPGKKVVLADPLYLTGDFDKDMGAIARFYSTIGGVQKSWIKNYLETAKSK